MDDQDDDGPDPALVRRRQLKARAARNRTIALLAVACVVGIAAIVFVAVKVAGRVGPGTGGGDLFGPSAGKEGEEWTFTELRDHLRSKGLQVGMKGDGLSVYFRFDDGPNRQSSDPETILCVRCDTAEQARQLAGANPESEFAWGRFHFSCNKDGASYLSSIHQAIYGKSFKPRP